MEFAVLGPLLVDGRPPPGGIERALLARLLVARGAPVSVGELIEAAWPPDRRAGAAASLRVRLTKLRGLLEPGREPGAPERVLVREPAGYRLAVDCADVDAERFVELAEEAGRLPAGAALERCERALALWRGEPFAELDLVDAAAAEARRLHGVRDRLRHLRALALLETGRADDAARELAALVAEDPLREELVGDLMRARYRAGRQAEALEAYRELARRLAELGLRPGPQLRELEALVLRHADELARPAVQAPGQRTNVGARIASVVGRERELADVLAALDAHRIVTLVGPGGVGKTTLASEVARAALERLPDGAWLVELASLREAAEAIPAAATALGLRRIARATDAGDRDALELLRERLGAARMLLVLDGGEQLLPGLARVARDLAGTGAGVKVLVTSRRPLALPGEAVIVVAPLGVPSAGAPREVQESAAGRLFIERARAARPGWQLGTAEAAAVARICRRLDGLPLALELAASRLRALSATAIAERLDEGLAVLGRGTLDASIEASHALLAPDEQQLFGRLSVLEGAFALEDAEQVGGGDGLAQEHVLELLVALAEHSMVQCEGEAPRRYRMLEALKAYARAQLDDEAAAAAARRHAAHLARLAAEAAARVDADGAEAAGEPLVGWRPDLEAAFRHALSRRDADLALDLAAGFGALHHRLGTVALGVERLDQALALDGGDPAKRLGALYWHVPLLVCELRVADARASLAQARVLHAQVGDARRSAGLRVVAGQLELCAGDLAAVEADLDGLPEELADRGEWFTAGAAATVLGAAAFARGGLEEAVALLSRARDLFAACPDVCSMDGAAADLAQAASAAGRESEAAAACAHALDFAPERPLGERNTHLLHEAAVLAARSGRADRAAQLASAATTAARRDPVAVGPWHAPAAHGDLALIAGRLDAARESYRQALALAAAVQQQAGPSMPASLYLASSELRLLQVARAAGDRDAALAHARAALEHARASGAPAVVGAALAAVQAVTAGVAAQ